ncbi:hypothetical protein C5167_003773 [Papaver somniferum]|uniref:Pectinesterase n=2 Tax=Papaver somniferum TaxID=3469 RepID=A0A4Y7L2Z5_PAPSO|nr:hypothetical protein C5167_003773 [Papaver somniferum]
MMKFSNFLCLLLGLSLCISPASFISSIEEDESLAPEYEKAAALLSSHDPQIVLAKVDANQEFNKALANEFKIVRSRRKKITDYKGPRLAGGMVEYSKKQVGPASAAIDSVEDASNLIRNPLSIISNPAEYDFLVAKDGSGNFSSIQEAVDHSPTRSFKRTVIRIRQGVYVENIVIPKEKINLYFVGDGRDVTIISGNRNQVHGYTIMTSATVGVEGDGFLARDITFENTAGPANFQAVALRINADASAVYRCNINGYQDTLFVQSFRQYFRECNISGTIDFIFGDSAVVFQQCNIITRLPSQGQYNAITASGRVNPDGKGGIVIQNCSILASEDLKQSNYTVETYLGRPWKACARTVIMKSYLDNLVHPKGWIEWEHNSSSVDSLWYGEYRNTGPGAKNDSRVEWKNYHKVMSIDEAFSFTVSEFIAGNEWLDSTGFPYQTGI